MGIRLRLSDIPIDQPLTDALYDCSGNLLMRRGQLFTAGVRRQFASQGIEVMEFGKASDDQAGNRPCGLRYPGTSEPAAGAALSANRLAPSAPRQSRSPQQAAAPIPPYDPRRRQRVERLFHQAASIVALLGQELVDETLRAAKAINEITNGFITELKEDRDQVVAQTLDTSADSEVALRSVQLSVLAMAVCHAMNLPASASRIAGAAAMLHDLALFRMPKIEPWMDPHTRQQLQLTYEWHPVIAHDMLEQMQDVDGMVRHVALQIHEQPDGSGFPRQLRGPRIHRLARVVNVADVYLRLTGSGVNDLRLYPADTMAYLMHHACAGRLDLHATYALVQVLSAYPIGTQVLLSNGSAARVLRCNPDTPLRPIVISIPDGSPIDLARTSEIEVAQPLAEQPHGCQRLRVSELTKFLW